MTKVKLIVNVATFCLIAVVAITWFKPPLELYHDEARDLPWAVADISQATSSWEVLDDGRIHVSITHVPMKGITPAMIAWWYNRLPISTVSLNGKDYPFYHLFHATEHGRIKLLEPPSGDNTGMQLGALVQRQEWFGPFDSQGAGRVVSFSDQGIVFLPEVAGMHFGEIRHSFKATPTGSNYRVEIMVGADLPIIGPLINIFVRNKIFHEEMITEWLRHQKEEVGNLNFFLPQLYASKRDGDHYTLEIN